MVKRVLPDADEALDARLRRESLVNLARLHDVLEAQDLQGLVLGDPLNVFHMLGYWPQIASTKVGQPPTSFALLARDALDVPGFVTSTFLHYYTWADCAMERPVQIWLYAEAGDGGDHSPAVSTDMFPDMRAAPLSMVEARRYDAREAVPLDRRSFRHAGGALVTAMKDMGLWRGRIAVDDPVVHAVCLNHGHPGAVVAADNILRDVRMVKSPLEIALMRRASAANVAAVEAVGRSIRAGAGYRDLRAAFDTAAVREGNRPVFMTIDRVSSELSTERIADGQTLFIDGVSHYRRYHGDYARTVFVGEPLAPAKRAAAAARHGWNAVREILRPGLRYSEIVASGRAAVRKAGFDETVGFGPHSVGLMHTDEPCDVANGFYRKADLVLRENMILSVDCPVMDTGTGGSAHIEDLMLITADGAEPIHNVGDAVIVI